MLTILLYTRKECTHCVVAREQLNVMEQEFSFLVVELDIDEDPSLQTKFGDSVPVLQIGPYIMKWPFTIPELRMSLGAAQDRKKQLEELGDKGYQQRIKRGRSITGADRFSFWFSKNYMHFINLILFIYIGLPMLAPILMKNNITGPAKVIYTIYSPLCHQLGFRSVFLFGEQPFYPRSLANLDNWLTYEEITHQDDIDVLEARKYLGDQDVGYKTALCQRDLAIYGTLFGFSLLFTITRRKIKAIPWYLWIIIGLIPIGVDGLSQLPSFAVSYLPGWIYIRESTPFLRFLTGSLFGIMTAWYLFPMVEDAMLGTREILSQKFSLATQIDKQTEHQEEHGISNKKRS